MGWSSYALLTLILIVDFMVALFGARFSYVVTGVPEAAGNQLGTDWTFIFDLMTFQVDGMPAALTFAFLLIQILAGFIVVKLIRGTD